MSFYGKPPRELGAHHFSLPEVMYYLYLPVVIEGSAITLPPNVERCRPLIRDAMALSRPYRYVYLSARRGWATPDNPLNRPGWHCDGFGSDDLNFVWWRGPGTRFAVQEFTSISDDHLASLQQFDEQIRPECVTTPGQMTLYGLDRFVVHATPGIAAPGCERQYVKVSLSDEKYDLEGNSHNDQFDYNWPLYSRSLVRNDTKAAQQDFCKHKDAR